MKKLLLLLLFTISSNAQIAQPTPYMLCDYGISNFEVFDLTTKIPEILNGLNPQENWVAFYSSPQDALNNTNTIANPTSYINMIFPVMTLGVRVTNNLGEHSYTTLDIGLLPAPTANPATLQFCDPNELPIYNLDNAIPQIINGNPNVTVTFYETQAAAETASSPIVGGGYIPLVNPGTQILFARVQNLQNDCAVITTLTLNTQNCNQNCLPPNSLTVSGTTSTSAIINWANPAGSTLWEVIVLPIGTPDPLPNTSGTIVQVLPYVVTGLSPYTCYSFYVRAICGNAPVSNISTWTGPLSFCTYDCANNGGCPQSLTLVSFLDANNNGVKDTGESNFNLGNFVYEINNSGNQFNGYPNDGHYYIFDSNPSNSYDFSFLVSPTYAAYFSSAVIHNDITLPSGSGSNTYYFPISQLGTLNDLEVQIIPSGSPRPGFTYGNSIYYKNKGTETISSGTLSFVKSPVVSIVNISQSGTNTTATGFEYIFSNLLPNEQRYIYVQMQVPTIPTVSLGDIITNSVMIEPLAGDAFPSNNNSSLSQTIIGSYDPNDKAESHGGQIVFEDFTANDYLYYNIRFENTGTANAEFIRVEDVLHADLDENTFEMLNTSHTVNTRREGNQLIWHFFDIDLPPSSININDGHGFVHFRIKPKAGYAIGDVIPNTASIFFDYNPPIVTNTFNTEFVETLGNPDFDWNTIVLHPNPAQNFVTISNPNEKISVVNIYEVTGKRIFTINQNMTGEININVANFAKGLYLVALYSANGQKSIKKLIIK